MRKWIMRSNLGIKEGNGSWKLDDEVCLTMVLELYSIEEKDLKRPLLWYNQSGHFFLVESENFQKVSNQLYSKWNLSIGGKKRA